LLVAFRLILNTKKIEKSSLGSPGLEEVNWLVPVRPNDILSCKVTVMSARLSKKKDYGIVKILIEIFNQEKKIVANLKAIWMLSIRSEYQD
jgi:acyl dehydratase